jgi:hypothetical protein
MVGLLFTPGLSVNAWVLQAMCALLVMARLRIASRASTQTDSV